MRYTRIFADAEGESHFEDVEVDLVPDGPIGSLSGMIPVNSLQFRLNEPDYDWDFHTAPARQFIILLDGAIEITTSLGESRIFKAGEVLLVEDTTGKGHKTRNIHHAERRSIFIQI